MFDFVNFEKTGLGPRGADHRDGQSGKQNERCKFCLLNLAQRFWLIAHKVVITLEKVNSDDMMRNTFHAAATKR